MQTKKRASAPRATRPAPSPVTTTTAHPAALTVAKAMLRPGQHIVIDPDGAVRAVNNKEPAGPQRG